MSGKIRRVPENGPFLVFGHRGAAGSAPENTLLSIRKALEFGVHGVEVDVYFVDGELAVIHDETLDRTTNGKGLVERQSFAFLRQLDAGQGERIPTLREVFDAAGDRMLVNVELKGKDTAAPVVSLIKEYVAQRGWPWERVLVSSFSVEELRRARELSPELRIGLLHSKRITPEVLSTAQALRSKSLHLAWKCATADAVRAAHCEGEGLEVFVYTVNSARQAIELERMGVNGVFSDFPDRILRRRKAPGTEEMKS